MGDSQCTEDSTSGSNQVRCHLIYATLLVGTASDEQERCEKEEEEGCRWCIRYVKADAVEA